jgi:hypothetical protein
MTGFSLGGAINSTADWACSAPIVHGIVNNPIFTALLITALVAVIILSLYQSEIKNAGNKLGARALFYIFLMSTAIIFVHHYAMTKKITDSVHQDGVRKLHSSIKESASATNGFTPIIVPGLATGMLPGMVPDYPVIGFDDSAIEYTNSTVDGGNNSLDKPSELSITPVAVISPVYNKL